MKIKKMLFCFVLCVIVLLVFAGCELDKKGSEKDISNTVNVANELQQSQSTPTDISYSLERYNLIKRAYWVNGQREKASTLPCAVEKPLGYIVLFSDSGAIVGSFIVDGKITSLNSFLTPNTYYESAGSHGWLEKELADVDGSYGENDGGIFFFTPDGKYLEWTGNYLYSDIPFEVSEPILTIKSEE